MTNDGKLAHLGDVAKNAQTKRKRKLEPQKAHKGDNSRGN